MTLHILGIGSPSGDDQAGWLVVDALRARGVEAGGRIALAKLDRPGASLLARLEGADHVILVDALQSDGTPGEIHRWIDVDWSLAGADLSSHGFGVLAALALARRSAACRSGSRSWASRSPRPSRARRCLRRCVRRWRSLPSAWPTPETQAVFPF